MKKTITILTICAMILALSIIFASCGKCEHTYFSECDEICNECGETRTTTTEHYYYGDCDSGCHKCFEDREVTAEHSWTPATCTTGEACEGCGAVKSGPLGHTWVDADCDTPKTCSVCEITEGNALGHTWVDADCDTPKTCSVCEITEGNALGHTPAEDDGDCTTEVECTACGEITTPAKTEHTQSEDDGDCTTSVTCEHCDHIFVEAKSHDFATGEAWSNTHTAHWYKCLNEGCKAKNDYGEHIPEEDDGDCTTHLLCDKCGWVVVEGNDSHTPNADDGNCLTEITCSVCGTVTTEARDNHTGGTDTCVRGKICDICNTVYGNVDSSNHASENYTYTDSGDRTHTKKHECCGVIVGESEPHTFDPTTGKCEFCKFDMEEEAKLTSGETDTYYETLMDALTASSSGDTVTLCEYVDIGDISYTIPEGVTFNGGEYSLFGSEYIDNYGIIESGMFSICVNNYGTVKGGKFDTTLNNYGDVLGGSFLDIGCHEGSYFSGPIEFVYSWYYSTDCTFDLKEVTIDGQWITNDADQALVVSSLNLPEGYAVEVNGTVVSALLPKKTGYIVNHTHTYKPEFDDTHHWTECACGKTTEKAEHSDLEYTNNGDGTHSLVCQYCDYVEVENERHTFDSTTDECVCGLKRIHIADYSVTGDFPSGWNNETNLDGTTGIIGILDAGKTAWKESDWIVIDFASNNGVKEMQGLKYYGNVWTATVNMPLYYFSNEMPTIRAIYSPYYKIDDFGFVLWGSLDGSNSSKKGTCEYIEIDCGLLDSETIAVNFSTATRNYSRLRIVAMAGQELTITTTGFTPAGASTEATGAYTITADEKGNAYLYGTFAEGATVTVKDNTNEILAEYTFTEKTEVGTSYVLKAVPPIEITFTETGFEQGSYTSEALSAPTTASFGFQCLNSEQNIGGGAFPASHDYQIKVTAMYVGSSGEEEVLATTDWVDENNPDYTKTGGDEEATSLAITQEMLTQAGVQSYWFVFEYFTKYDDLYTQVVHVNGSISN